MTTATATKVFGTFYPVVSSTVEAYSVEASGKKINLLIRFKHGSTYRYLDVGQAVVEGFEQAPSKGRFIASDLRDAFLTEKV